MREDRCQHVPTAPGQTICACKDYQMWLEHCIALQARYIDVLTRRLETSEPVILNLLDSRDASTGQQ